MDEPLSGWFEINGSGRSQQWTQNDLQDGKVQFHHNGKDDVKIENFVFEVTDGSNIVILNLKNQFIDHINYLQYRCLEL